MTVFKTFLRVLNKCKSTIIIYTVFLIFFGAFNMTTSDNSTNFVESKPKITIVNDDREGLLTKHLIEYLKENNEYVELNSEEAINDAIFYRQINYYIHIPESYSKNLLNGKNPEIEIKSTGEYQSTLAEMNLERYIKLAKLYSEVGDDEQEIIESIDKTLSENIDVEITSKLDTDQLSKATFYYNFTNYCLLAGAIYVICLILSSFKQETIKKRTIISSMNYRVFNRQLLLSNSLFTFTLWFFYVLLSFILLGNIMFTMHGLLYIINSFVFTICVLTIAFLLGNIVKNKEAVNGIVNVIALGSSFLCGAFVPMEWLPNFVLNIAHILPSYWFIKSNETIKTLEIFELETLKPILINMSIILAFALLFIVLTNIVTRHKRKID